MEAWKDVKGFEGYYAVSSNGDVKSLDRTIQGKRCKTHIKERVMRQHVGKDGYPSIQLFSGGKPFTLKVHRLVAQAFLDNPDNLPEVNHIDGNKQNNTVDNLEWCTRGHNIRHAFRTGLIKKENMRSNAKKVRRSDGVVFDSLTKAAEESGTHISDVSMCCHGKLAHTAGYGFEFV